MALGSTQPQTEIINRHTSWGGGGGCVRLTTLPLSYADRLEIWKSQNTGNLGACPGPSPIISTEI